jgi:hypothetical protein
MRSARIPANGRPKVGRDETRVDPVPSERPVGAEATAIRGQKLVPVSLLLTFMDQVGLFAQHRSASARSLCSAISAFAALSTQEERKWLPEPSSGSATTRASGS